MKMIERAAVILYLCYCLFYLPQLLTKRDIKSMKVLTIIFIFQNFIAIIASDVFNSLITQIIILYKELVLYGAVILYCFFSKSDKVKKIVLPILVFLAIVTVYMMVGQASLYTRFISLRQLLTPIILILYGCTISITKDEFIDYVRFFIKTCIFLAIFGIIERFVLGDALWKTLNIAKYMNSKGFTKWTYNNGLPGNFYSADFYKVLGYTVRRLCGLAADPLLTGHYISIGIVFLLFNNLFPKIKQTIILTLLSITVFLTLSKGAILIISVAFIYKIYLYNKKLMILVIPLLIMALYVIISRNVFGTIARHVNGLTSSFSYNLILGGGMGTSGNYSNLYEGNSATTGESYIGMIIGQIGIVGLIAFINVFLRCSKNAIALNSNFVAYSIYAYVIACLIESLVSESAINFIGSGLIFLLFGLLSTNQIEEGEL